MLVLHPSSDTIDYSTAGDMGENNTAVDAVASGLQGELGVAAP